jgi:quercetin dioxygenase-like cupin family protein
MYESIEEVLKFNPTQKVVQVLHVASSKVIGLGLKKEQTLEKHTTSTAAFLFVHSGSISFLINGESLVMTSGDFYKIPENVEHEIKALEDSRLLLVK